MILILGVLLIVLALIGNPTALIILAIIVGALICYWMGVGLAMIILFVKALNKEK